jgi:bis(5'-nucleosidyl)-tetraphosphatase
MTPLTQPNVESPPGEAARPRRLSAGVVVVMVVRRQLKFLLLRAYRNWDFPKGMVEPGEQPIDAAVREVREETTLDDISFDWGMVYIDTGPYNKGKISRYYVARSKQEHVELLVNPELGMPEHQEARWVDVEQARALVSPRLQPVIDWAYLVVNHGVVNQSVDNHGVADHGQARRPEP